MPTFYTPQTGAAGGFRLGESLAAGYRDRSDLDNAAQLRRIREEEAARARAQEIDAAESRRIKGIGEQLALRGQILGTVETPADYAAALPVLQGYNLPMADLPEDRRSTASQTFRRPEVPATSQARAPWMPDFGAPMAPAALPSGEMAAQGIAPEDVPAIQRRAQAGLPLQIQQKFQDADVGRQIQLANLSRVQDKDALSREWMAFQRDAKVQGMTEAETQRAFQREMADKGYQLDVARFALTQKTAERDAKLGPKFTGDQTNAATFGRRLEQAIPYLEQAYTQFDPTTMQGSLQVEAARKGGLASIASNPAAKSAVTAELNILAAILRKESGAAISEGEYASAGKIYFPRYGDTPEIRAQKMETMRQALAGLKTAAGPAWDATPLVGEGPGAKAPKPAASGIPTVSSQAAYDALPPGAQYKAPDGRILTKKAR